MSSAIVDYQAFDNAVVVSNATIARPVSIPSNWKKLQIGLLYGLTTGSRANMAPASMYIGLCSGNTAILGDVTSSHFVGFKNTGTYAYASSSTYTHSTYTCGETRAVVLSPTKTNVSADLTIDAFYIFNAEGADGKKMINYCQITRSSVDSTLYHFVYYFVYTVGAASYGKVNENTLLRESQTITPTFTSAELVQTVSTRVNLSVDEAASGSLDHLCIAWDREWPAADLCVYAVTLATLE